MEIIVYIGIAVIVGGLVISFISGIKPEQIFSEKEPSGLEKINSEQLFSYVFQSHEKCINKTVYVSGNGTINKKNMFMLIKKFELCNSLQSRDNDCGSKEEINNFTISLPAVVSITCYGNHTVVE